MMSGVNILATEIVEVAHPIFHIMGWIAVPMIFIGIIFTIIGIALDYEGCGLTGLMMIILSFIIAITSAIAGQYITVPSYQKYEVILEDSVSMNEFMNKYEVLEQRGQIYVVKEIEE